MIYLQLIWVYIKIGLFGFGGGYAMLSLIQDDVVNNYHWITPQQFTDIVAISQMTPGPIGINSATYIGYTVTGNVWGAMAATLAVMLPSFILVLVISYFFSKFQNNKYVEAVFVGVRPTTIGLVASAALLLSFNAQALLTYIAHPGEVSLRSIVVTENFVDIRSLIFFVLAFIATIKKMIHPILLIVIAGILGLVFY